jgi:elongation factor 1-alpha
MEDKPKIHVVFFGDKGHGKSTLIGRLLFETGEIPSEIVEQYRRATQRTGREGAHFAWILDQSEKERESGTTADIRFREVNTSKYTIWAIDTPGHDDHIDRVAIGLAEADFGVLVVSIDLGVTARTEEQAVLARMLGVSQLIVAITKADVVDYSESHIIRLEKDLRSLLLEIGYSEDELHFIPLSALEGENISGNSRAMRWFKASALLETINNFVAPRKETTLPFRLPIDSVFYKPTTGTIVCGKIASGSVSKDDLIIIEPGGALGKVQSIEEVHEEQLGFEAGDNVGILVNGLKSNQVDVGYVMGHRTNPPVSNSWFTALVTVLHYPARIYVGQTLTLLVHAARVPVTIESIISQLDPKTEKLIQNSPPYLHTLDKGIIQFRAHQPVVIERPSVIPQLSRFVLRESYRTIAAGIRVEES